MWFQPPANLSIKLGVEEKQLQRLVCVFFTVVWLSRGLHSVGIVCVCECTCTCMRLISAGLKLKISVSGGDGDILFFNFSLVNSHGPLLHSQLFTLKEAFLAGKINTPIADCAVQSN